MFLTKKGGCLLTLCLAAPMTHALPFSITPTQTLPTQVVIGGSEPAFYQIKNNTNQNIQGVYLKYLPPNVTQVTDQPGYCGKNTNLAPSGNPGDSCDLYLLVWGDVNATDPDPHHHLFACAQGGISCAGVNEPYRLNVNTVEKPPIYTAGGWYNSDIYTISDVSNSRSYVPLVAQSSDKGNSWGFSVTSETTLLPNNFYTLPLSGTKLPSGIADIIHNAPVCNSGPVSIALFDYIEVARGNIVAGRVAPLLAATTNAGQSWSYRIDSSTATLPVNYSTALLSDVACSTNKYSIAVGYFNTLDNEHLMPLLMASRDGANTWQMDEVIDLPQDFREGNLVSVDCNASGACAAAGSYSKLTAVHPNTQIDTYPFVLINESGGTQWRFQAVSIPHDFISLVTSLPEDPHAYNLGIKYKNDGSIIVTATYSSNGSGYVTEDAYAENSPKLVSRYPFIARGTNLGTQWEVVVDSLTYSQHGFLTDVCCDGSYCSASGSTTDSTTSNEYFLLLASTDGGISWSQKINKTKTPYHFSTTPLQAPVLNAVSCQGKNAIAVGYYESNITPDNPLKPVAAVTTDGWQTFSYTIESGTNMPVNASGNTELYGVTIGNDGSSFVVGTSGFSDQTNGYTYPILAMSTNPWSAWTYKIYDNRPKMPRDYIDGAELNSVSENSSNALLPIEVPPSAKVSKILEHLAPNYALLSMNF